MARERDEDILEPILPKHPPYQGEVVAPPPTEVTTVVAATGPSWDRLVLVGCAVVATLALVIVALRTNSIAKDQRVQTCQVRVYAAEQASSFTGGRAAEQRIARELAKCVGIDSGDGK